MYSKHLRTVDIMFINITEKLKNVSADSQFVTFVSNSLL